MTKTISTSNVVSSMIKNQGKKTKGKAKAGVSGNMFESCIHSLEVFGFIILDYVEYVKLKASNKLPDRFVVRNKPYQNLIGRYKNKIKPGIPKTEFVICVKNANSTDEFPLMNDEYLEIRIECKWQAVPGTTQEKLPLTIMNLQYGAPESKVIIIMDGDGFTGGIHKLVNELCEDGITWKRAPTVPSKIIKKMKLDEFIAWANKAFG